jgi:hypothetical protein
VLADDARSAAAKVRAALSRAKVFLERSSRDKTQEALQEAQEAAAPILTAGSLMQSLDISKAAAAELAAVQRSSNRGCLPGGGRPQQLAQVTRAISRSMDASDALASLRTTMNPLLGSSLEDPRPSLPSCPTSRPLWPRSWCPYSRARATSCSRLLLQAARV